MTTIPAQNKHTSDNLKYMQALPLNVKIGKTAAKIMEFYREMEGKVYVSFSGGKDSTVLLYLVKELYPDIPVVWCDTGLEYSEVRDFVNTFNNVIIVKPRKTFENVIKTCGYPVISKEQSNYIENARTTKSSKLLDIRLNGTSHGMFKIAEKYKYLLNAPFPISDRCCHYIKKDPLQRFGRKAGIYPIIATLADESKRREMEWYRYGCNLYHKDKAQSKPMSFWTEQDVLAFISKKKIPICKIYGEVIEQNGVYQTTGETRTGCIYCMYGVHLEGHPNRFEKMKETHPKQYAYCMDTLHLHEVLDYIKVAHGYGE